MKRDQVIFDIIEREHQRQLKGSSDASHGNMVDQQVC
jgi:hypothetical protein